jgi:biotin carboxyl carrier protein
MNAAVEKLSLPDEQPLRPVLELIATSLEHQKFQAAATAVLSKLATGLGCNSASFGVVKNKGCKVLAVSHSASMDERMNLTHATAAAMNEALDQDTTVVFPQPDDRSVGILHAHTEFVRQAHAGSVCTLPVNHDDQLVGAILLESPVTDTFDTATVALCESMVALVGPILNSKLLEERSLSARALDAARDAAMNLVGPEHAALKLAGITAAATILILTFAFGEYRVSASAKLEGMVQRVVVAPMDGFIMDAKVRPGDIVAEGDLLYLLDDTDLKLERTRWFSQLQETEKSYRSALSNQDRIEVMRLKAKLDQAAAKLELSEQRLARTRMPAPLAGVIVAGDLSQSLGAPVERGQVLFEIAPLDEYRVMLEVDERDIGQLVEEQTGVLALAGLPHDRFTFVVTRITPVSTSADGRNFFMVEASLDKPDPLLRPGMQGVGKIIIGERRLGWILTHELTDWLRLWLWA